MYKILICDLETENKPWLGKTASPFNPENYIVAPGWRLDTVNDDGSVTVGEIHHRYFTSVADADAGADWFDVVDDAQIIVAHNSMFEQQWFLSKHREKFEAFLKRGGRLLDTALAEYLLSHQQELYPSLDEIAPRHGGTHKVDGVKILWQNGALTSEIDKDLLLEYLIGPSGDIENTGLVFYSQIKQLGEAGMLNMFYERCEANLAFGYCEWFGLYVDMDVANKNLAEQEAQIAELTAQLQHLLPDDLPDWVEFNWGSGHHMSALVYGGPVKGRQKVSYDPPQYVKADFYKDANDGSLRLVVPDELYGPVETYKSGKNKGMPKVFREDTTEEKLKWGDAFVQLPGLVRLESLPEVVRSKYLGKRAEFRGALMLSDGVTPIYSTSEDALKGLKNFVPEVALMVELASLEKDTSTYYLRVEYATSKPNRAVSVSETMESGEPGQSGLTRPQETSEAQVRSDLGSLAGDADSLREQVPSVSEGSGGEPDSTPSGEGGTGPLPRDGQGARCAVSHLQQSVGDGGRQPSGSDTLREIPRVGVNGCTKVKGMLQFVGPDSIVHHSLNTTATVTTRLSSSTPNLQNLPRDGTSRVKAMFTSRFGTDGRIVEVDYSALEVVMLCAMTGDTDLLKLLLAGTDMHCYRLAFKLGEPYEDVLRKAVTAHDPDSPDFDPSEENKRYKQMRTDIKPLSFADQYGASAEGIAFNTGCTVEFAQEFQDNEAKMFPISRGYRSVIAKEVERTGMEGVRPSGIHREMADDGTWRVYRRGHFQGPSGTCYSFRQKPTFDKVTRQRPMMYKATEMANYPFQGESGFLMSSAMGQIVRHMIKMDWYDNQVCLINNVHDASYVDAANETVGREAGLAVKAIMEAAPVRLASIFPNFAIGHVPFPAAAEMGESMYSKVHLH